MGTPCLLGAQKMKQNDHSETALKFLKPQSTKESISITKFPHRTQTFVSSNIYLV